MLCAASVVVVHALAKTETRQAPVHHRWGLFVSVCLFVCLSVRLSVCLSVCLCLSVCVSVCLSCRGRGVDPVVGEPPGIPEDPWSCLVLPRLALVLCCGVVLCCVVLCS